MMETVIDKGRGGDFPQLDGYDEKMATVCQALGIEPESWQVRGRTLEGVPFWARLTAEDLCWAFVDRIEDKRSHLIFARYPEPTDAWALEAIKAAAEQGMPCEIRCDSGTWLFRFWSKTWGWLSGLPGAELGAVVCAGLSYALACEALTGRSAR